MGKRRQDETGRPRPLPTSFYARDTVAVARGLLGALLVRRLPSGDERRAVIVETEAYLGVTDRAAHTWNGRRTPRVLPIWGPPGHAYVYLVYGLHTCLNVVTREEGTPEAVLVRAAVPPAWWRGEETEGGGALGMSGPGRLCRVLGVGVELSGASLSGPDLVLSEGPSRLFRILSGPRVGVAYAGDAALWPLRFAVDGCPAVTERRTLGPRARGRAASRRP